MKNHIATRYGEKTFCGLPTELNVYWSDSVKFLETRLPKNERVSKSKWCKVCKSIAETKRVKQLTGEEIKAL